MSIKMVSLKGVLGGDKLPTCIFCERKKIPASFWDYWKDRLSIEGIENFKKKFKKEIGTCAHCWSDIHILDRCHNGRLKLYMQSQGSENANFACKEK